MQTFCFLPSSISNSVGLGPMRLRICCFEPSHLQMLRAACHQEVTSLSLADSRSLSLSFFLSLQATNGDCFFDWIGVLENCTYKKCNRSSNVEAVKDEVFDNSTVQRLQRSHAFCQTPILAMDKQRLPSSDLLFVASSTSLYPSVALPPHAGPGVSPAKVQKLSNQRASRRATIFSSVVGT